MRYVLLLISALLFSSVAFAGTTFTNLPAANQPIGNSGTSGPTYVPMDQGQGCATDTTPCTTVQSDALRLGQPVQMTCALVPFPWQYQTCIDTSVSPHTLQEFIGAQWWLVATLDPSNGYVNNGSGGGGGGGGGSGRGVGVQAGQLVQAIGDDNVPLPSGHYLYETNAVFTANRTKTLPDSATQGVGDISIIDAFQGLSSHTLTICALGTDTINGGAGGGCAPVLAVIGSGIGLHNDGAGNWTVTWNTLLGVNNAPAHQFASGLSTSGLVYTQPAFTDLSGTTNVVGQLSVPATWTGIQTFQNVVGSVLTVSGTSHLVANSDCGKTLLFTSSSASTITLLNSVPLGCVIAVEQGGTGTVTIAAGAGSSFDSAFFYIQTRTQFSVIGLTVDTNLGGFAAHYVVTGDGA